MTQTKKIRQIWQMPVGFALGLVFISLAVFLAWRAFDFFRQGNYEINGGQVENTYHVVSINDIRELPDNATFLDVEKLLNGNILTNDSMYRAQAKEGGIFLICFFPTKEIPKFGFHNDLEKSVLTAIIKFPDEKSLEAGYLGDGNGVYVYPAALYGAKFGGILFDYKILEL